jgi:Na+/H+-translocating membrane pyrophosphatase
VEDAGVRRTSAAVYALITLRFLLELALLFSYVLVCVRLLDGALGWVVGLLLAVAVATVWGMLLSPRRPVRLPLAARLGIELALFAAASSLLALSGLGLLGVGLMALELLDLGLLQGPDKHAL